MDFIRCKQQKLTLSVCCCCWTERASGCRQGGGNDDDAVVAVVDNNAPAVQPSGSITRYSRVEAYLWVPPARRRTVQLVLRLGALLWGHLRGHTNPTATTGSPTVTSVYREHIPVLRRAVAFLAGFAAEPDVLVRLYDVFR